MKNIALPVLGLAWVAVLAGCRSTKDVLDDYDRNITAGNYASLSPESHELAEKKNDSQLLWRLMSAGGRYLACDSGAIAEFDRAEDIFIENDNVSVFKQAGDGTMAMLANDKALPYGGYGQDRIFACFYKAVDYASSGKNDGARTELNRAELHQKNWIYERRRDILAASERLESDAAQHDREESGKGVKDDTDRAKAADTVLSDANFMAQVKDKCGFDYATSGDLDALEKSKDSYVNHYVENATEVFRYLVGDKGVPAKNLVYVYIEDGLCPVREEWRIDLPLILLPYLNRYVMYAGMALPYLRERSVAANNWTVNGVTPTLLEDMDKLLHVEYDVYMRGALPREITRTVIKVGAQVACGVIGENSGNSYVQYSMLAARAAAATWAVSTTAADLRCWTALPKRVLAVKINRPVDGNITVNADGVPFSFTVPEGNAMVFIRKTSAMAGPVVKIANFM